VDKRGASGDVGPTCPVARARCWSSTSTGSGKRGFTPRPRDLEAILRDPEFADDRESLAVIVIVELEAA
jgi:hypothetical protein